MSRMLCRCAALAAAIALMMPGLARAAKPTVSIKALREETPAYWQGEYTGKKGRTVRVDAPVLMPVSDTFPVARMARNFSTEEALAAYQEDLPEDSAGHRRLEIQHIGRITRQESQLKKEGCFSSIGGERTVHHWLWAPRSEVNAAEIRAEGQNLTLADAGERLGALVKKLYGEEYGIVIDHAGTNGTPVKMKEAKGRYQTVAPLELGEDTGKGSYSIDAILTYRGIPQLGGPKFRTGYNLRHKENLLDWSYHGARMMRYLSDDVFFFDGDAFEVTEVVEEDVPLCGFEDIKRAIAGQIERGRIQHVYALYLGWVYWLDPSVDYPEKAKDRAKGVRMPFLATPVWLVDCVGASSSGRDYEEYPETEINGEPYDYRKHQWGSTVLMINAQTAEVYDQWEDSARRKYAPKVIPW